MAVQKELSPAPLFWYV